MKKIGRQSWWCRLKSLRHGTRKNGTCCDVIVLGQMEFGRFDIGPYPLCGWDLREKFRKIFGKTPLSEFFLEPPSRVRLGPPKPISFKAFEGSRALSEFSPAHYGCGFFSWFWRGPLRAGHGIPSSTGGVSETCRACRMNAVRTAFGKLSNPSHSGDKFREGPSGLIQHVLTALGGFFSNSSLFQKNAFGNPWVGSSDSGKTAWWPSVHQNRGRTVGGGQEPWENRGRVKRTAGEPWGLHREPWENRGGCAENRGRTVGTAQRTVGEPWGSGA